MFLYLLLLFTVVPIVEIWLLIRIGEVIHAGPTIALVILTGVVGAALARREGLRVFARINQSLAHGEMPANEVVEGVMILVAGLLLVTPGIITDFVGFSVLIPPLRALIRKGLTAWFKKQVVVLAPGTGFRPPGQEEFIDVEYRDVTDSATGESSNEPPNQLP